MRQIEYSGQFKRALKQLKKRGKDMDKLKLPIKLIIEADDLLVQYRDHLPEGCTLAEPQNCLGKQDRF